VVLILAAETVEEACGEVVEMIPGGIREAQ
jgi:hypothetical protein